MYPKITMKMLLTIALAQVIISPMANALNPSLSVRRWTKSVSTGFQQRVEADSSFPMKSATELVLAAGTQLSAEWNRRGTAAMVPEFDFIVAGVLTAMCGKYYTMWRVAPTANRKIVNDDDDASSVSNQDRASDATIAGIPVPTNAFQPTLLDGVTKPSPKQRVLSFFAPMPSLFQAGIVASALGYGLTAVLIALRAYLIPSYIAATRNVNIMHASIYTGVFMALVSNIRYQLLQGIVEPLFIDKFFRKKYPVLHSILTFAVRLANGFSGSVLAIMGMRTLGLQKLK
jgi:hypothetical protein